MTHGTQLNSGHGLEVRGKTPRASAGLARQTPQRLDSGRPRRRSSASAAPSPLPSPRELLYVLFRHRVRAGVVAITLFTLTFLAAIVLPSKYTSEAQLLVRMGRESLPNATVAAGPQMVPMVDRTTEINSEAQIFRSREVVEATVRKLGIDKLLGGKAATDPRQHLAQERSAARTLAQKLDVRTEPMSAIIKVSFDDKDPEKAREVVQTYVDAYLDHRSRIYGGSGADGLFEGLTADSENKLKSIEESIKKLKDQTGVSDVTTQKNILLNRIANLEGSIDGARAQLAASVRRIASIETQLATTPKQIQISETRREPMGVVSNAENELNKLKSELDQKLVTYLPTSPVVKQLEEQIARAEARLRELEKTSEGQTLGLNPTWSELDKQLTSERTTKEGLEAQLAALDAEATKARQGQAVINDVELQMGQLAREQGMMVEQLRKVVEGRDYSTIDQAMRKDRVGNVITYQPATTPVVPSSPNRKLIVLFGLFFATIAGMGTALVSEMLDQTVNKPQDLKRLGFGRIVSIPVLRIGTARDAEPEASLSPEAQAIVDLSEHGDPSAETSLAVGDRLRPTRYVRSTSRGHQANGLQSDPSLSPRELLQQWKARPAVIDQPATVAKSRADSVVVNAPASRPTLSPRFLEACNAILERLVFAPVATGEFAMPRSIGVVSVTPGQGTSTLAAHLAAALADQLPNGGDDSDESNRVLLVDGNLAAPAQHRVMGVANEPGISDWLKQTGDEPSLGDFARESVVGRLDVLPAGAASVGHQPGRWADAAELAMRSNYHTVVLDLPSMARSESTARVAGMCDAALLVVECGGVNREVVRQAALRLAESGVRLLGVVLNKRTYPIPEKLYRWI